MFSCYTSIPLIPPGEVYLGYPPCRYPHNWHLVTPAWGPCHGLGGGGSAALTPGDSTGGLEESIRQSCPLGARGTF